MTDIISVKNNISSHYTPEGVASIFTKKVRRTTKFNNKNLVSREEAQGKVLLLWNNIGYNNWEKFVNGEPHTRKKKWKNK